MIALFIILFGLLSYYIWNRRKYYILSWKMHSILGLPFLGIALDIWNAENLLTYATKMRKKFKNKKTNVLWFGPQPFIYVSEPDIIKRMLTSSVINDKIDLYKIINKYIGDGILTVNNPTWKNHRKLIDPAFKLNVLKNYLPIFNEKADVLMRKLSEFNGGQEFDMLPLAQLTSLDMACHTTMGKSMNFLLNENSKIRNAYCTLMRYVTKRILTPILHFDFIFELTNMATQCLNAQTELLRFVEALIIKNMSKGINAGENVSVLDTSTISDCNKSPLTNDKSFNNDGNDDAFIDRTICLLRNNQFSWKDAIDNSNIIVAAAFETTANTVSCILLCLAMHPEYQEKLFKELIDVFPYKDNITVTYEDTLKLKYLEMVINETLRFLPAVPFIGRVAQDDYTLTDDIILPKGSQIVIDIFHMHRDDNIWGENAEIFYPDHFLPENFNKIPSFAFIPFAKGARNCIGRKYAMLAMKTILSKILRKYYVSTDFQYDDMKYLFNLTLKFQKPPLLKIHERDE